MCWDSCSSSEVRCTDCSSAPVWKFTRLATDAVNTSHKDLTHTAHTLLIVSEHVCERLHTAHLSIHLCVLIWVCTTGRYTAAACSWLHPYFRLCVCVSGVCVCVCTINSPGVSTLVLMVLVWDVLSLPLFRQRVVEQTSRSGQRCEQAVVSALLMQTVTGLCRP